MSLTGRATPSPSNLQLIINALADYAKQTEIDVTNNPFYERIKLLNSPKDILELLQERENAFRQYREGNRKLISSLSPAVEVLHALSGILGEAVSLVPFSPAKAVFTSIDVLLAAASEVTSSYDALLELFDRLANFLERLKIYTKIPPTTLMMNNIVQVMAELLSVLALTTKQIRQGRIRSFFTKLFRKDEVKAMLQKLDRLTQEEARMAIAETLGTVHGLVGDVRAVRDDGEAATNSIHQMLGEMNKMKRDQLQRDVQDWLKPPDPSTNHDFVWKAHHTGTASWFFESDALSKWKETGTFLWIHGKPGSGKSTLLSAIIENIEGMCTAGLATMAYYYFDFRDVKKQNRDGLLSSLLSQLSTKSDPGFDILSQLYSKHADGTGKLTPNALTKCLKDMLSLPGQGQIYIIVDALDECPDVSGRPSAREEVLELVEELVGLSSKLSNLRICVASRPESDIRESLEPLEPLQISLHNESGQKVDIIEYIKSVVRSDSKMKKWRDQDKQLAIELLSERADGMFRWVVCQFDCLRYSKPASIRSALANMPESLDETYEKALLGINKENQKFAKRLFQCLLMSFRPLRVEELAEILAVEFDSTSAPSLNEDLRSEDAEEAVLSTGSSLIAIVNREGDQIVQFSHYSVKEFLTSDRLATAEERLSCYHLLPEPAHTLLADACLCVLLRLDNKIDRSTIGRFPLAPYAARHWVDHAKFRDESSRIEEVMEPLFDQSKPHFAAWVWLYDIDHPWVDPMSSKHPKRPEAVPLYYAALCGFGGLVGRLLASLSLDIKSIGDSDTSDISTSDFALCGLDFLRRFFAFHLLGINGGSSHATPLYAPLPVCGIGLLGRLLVSFSLDINSRGGSHTTPLDAILCRYSGRTGRYLTSLSLDINCRCGFHTTSLHVSAHRFSGLLGRLLVSFLLDINNEGDSHAHATQLHAALYRLLFSLSLDTNCRGGSHSTPLHAAAVKGHVEAASMLLKSGADPNSRDDMGRVPLHRVTHGGHLVSKHSSLEIARLLINSGAYVDVTSNADLTPLHAAALNGDRDISEQLLISGASLEARDRNQQIPLHLACGNGRLDVTRLLIDHGSDLKSRDNEGFVPLHKASRHGHVDVARLLLDCGSDVNVRDTLRRTPLHLASRCGHLGLARLLIDRSSAVNACAAELWTPLHFASIGGHLDVAELLVKKGANVNSQNDKKMTSLFCVAETGHLDVARFLVESGADVSARSNNGWTPFHQASYFGRLQIANFLLERGVDVDIPIFKLTSLCLASYSGKLDVVRFLIEHGADIQIKDSNGANSLHIASQRGHLDIVQMLINAGIAVDFRTLAQKTPLALASREGKAEVGKLLIGRGADVNARDEKSRAPLHLAAQYGHFDVVKLLLNRGVDSNVQKDNLWSPLHLASAHGHLRVAELLVQCGARVDVFNCKRETPLHLAAGNGKVEIARLLIDHGANLYSSNNNGWTPLHAASRRGHLRVVKLLLRCGTCYETTKAAAELASENGKTEVARFITEYKADVNIRKKIRSTTLDTDLYGADEDGKDGGKTLLHTAVENGNIDFVKSLLERGADVNGRNANNVTPLHMAAYKGNHDVARLLIKAGAEVDLCEKFGWTPLHDASRQGNLEVARVLVDHGANTNARGKSHWTPLDLSVISGHLAIVKLLLERGADVHTLNGDGQTPYQVSLAAGYPEIADLLLKHGAGQSSP